VSRPATEYACSGCGAAPVGPPFRCPHAGEGDVDHVMARARDPEGAVLPSDGEDSPFLRYRSLLHPYHLAIAGGLDDADYVAIARRLDEAVRAVDGRGFRRTPFSTASALATRLGLDEGALLIKDETGNVSGSHKGRHLMGIAIYLEVIERLGLHPGHAGRGAELAIASCGNAALAAAVVARAAGRALAVYIPPDADPVIVDRLGALGARLTVCARQAGVAGDPCYHRFRAAVEAGALPFSCQGPDNGLTIEGGRTLVYEMLEALRGDGRGLDRVFIQVGGGALGSACAQALAEAARRGWLPRLPRLHAVQTRGAFPLARAWERLAALLLPDGAPGDERERAEALRATISSPAGDAALRHAATHRSAYMWPWESEPRSIAHGILDDETYDWRALVEGMLRSGGWPIVVGEEELAEANALGRAATGIDVDPTGSAGLAGMLALHRRAGLERGERVAVLFSGARRA
jgi:threonine synthase